MQSTEHPRWASLLMWLESHGMDTSPAKLPVQARSCPGAGYGLFSVRPIAPSEPLFCIPPKALINSLTLTPHYPAIKPKLTCTQIVSLHLLLHRPQKGHASADPLYGPYISILPEDFDSHPLKWLWDKEHGSVSSCEAQLIDALPPRILAKLDKMANLYEVDWNVVKSYLQTNPSLLNARGIDEHLQRDYLWAWLNVNTRCVYHRLMKSRSSPDNMTLCPILDFANHTRHPPHTMPQPTDSEIWDTGPLGRKFGENFVLLAPSTTPTLKDQEIYLNYGPHSNATLFSEYGFIISSQDEQEAFAEECDLQDFIEELFLARGEVGSWMKECLLAEGYWGDWTLHSLPGPAHPSFRLITTLRLYHLLPLSMKVIPSNSVLLDRWKNTTLGLQDSISHENELLWRKTLLEVCKRVVKGGVRGIEKIRQVQTDEVNAQSTVEAAKHSIEMLWKEEMKVAAGVIDSIEANAEF